MSEVGGRRWALAPEKKDLLASPELQRYIQYGETDCKAKGGVICSQTQACKERASKKRKYNGWYDLGGTFRADFFAPRYSPLRTRFTKLDANVALDVDLIAFRTKQGIALTDKQLEATLAHLNSSYVQTHIEMNGRATGMGQIAMEVATAETILIPDPRQLNASSVRSLAKAFNSLEKDSRAGASAQNEKAERLLWEARETVDTRVTRTLGLEELDLIRSRKDLSRLLARRRQRRKRR